MYKAILPYFLAAGGRCNCSLVTQNRVESGVDSRKLSQRCKSVARKLISSGSEFEASIGYSRAVVDGNWVMVSGTTGYDYSTMTLADGVLEQTEQCMKNIESALNEAGAKLADVVRVMYIYPDAQDFPKCWPVLSRYFGNIRPAATMISAGLLDPAMKVEIQVTALKQSPN